MKLEIFVVILYLSTLSQCNALRYHPHISGARSQKSEEFGETGKYEYLGRALTLQTAEQPESIGYIMKTITFPDVSFKHMISLKSIQNHSEFEFLIMFFFKEGPLYSKQIIRGFRHSDYAEHLPNFDIVSGGIGKNHIKIIVSSKKPGEKISSMFHFYGERL